MTNLYPFTQDFIQRPFSEFFFNVSLWNQYKCITFSIFLNRILIISYKRLIITGISNEKKQNKCINHKWNIMLKRHNILLTRNSFFILRAEKIESVQEFKIKLF